MQDSAVLEYLEYVAMKGYSAATIKTRRWILNTYQVWLGRETESASAQDITHYAGSLIKKRSSQNMQRYILLALRKYYAWLVSQERMLVNPAGTIAIPKRVDVLPRVADHDTLMKILTKTEGSGYLRAQDRAVFEVLYSTGIRRRELLGIRTDEVDLSRKVIRIRQAKNGVERVVPLGACAYEALERYIYLRAKKRIIHDREWLWVNYRGWRLNEHNMGSLFRRYCPRGTITPHGLRHACAVGMLKNGAGIMNIKELLGHKRLTSTQLYTKLTIDDMKAMCRKHHPRKQKDIKGSPGKGICKKYYRMK